MPDVVVTAEELKHRTILRTDLVADRAAFLDTRIPGSDQKINYPLIGPGVSENEQQVVPVSEPHGFNLGAAELSAGVLNNLHLHFTAEVFSCFAGEWQFRWGVNGDEGEAVVRDGDVISIPTWMFRGFTSLTDGAFLYTALGGDESGGLIWAPSVIEKAAQYGRHLTVDGRLVDTEPGEIPTGVELVRPLTGQQLEAIRHPSAEEMRARLIRPDEREWCNQPFLDSQLPGGGAELSLAIGYGLTEDREQRPRLSDPHGFSLAWLRAEPAAGMLTHRVGSAQVLIVKRGRLRVTLNTDHPVSTEIGPFDTISIPVDAWRSFESVGSEALEAVVITQGDGRNRIDWHDDVRSAAREKGVALDANGYLAPAELIST